MDGGVGCVVGVDIPFVLTGLVGNPFLPKSAEFFAFWRLFQLAMVARPNACFRVGRRSRRIKVEIVAVPLDRRLPTCVGESNWRFSPAVEFERICGLQRNMKGPAAAAESFSACTNFRFARDARGPSGSGRIHAGMS